MSTPPASLKNGRVLFPRCASRGLADITVFELYIERILAPRLQAGQIVILDNLNTQEQRFDTLLKRGDANSCFCPPTLLIYRQLRERFRNSKRFYAAWSAHV